jgi:hypothetical protein
MVLWLGKLLHPRDRRDLGFQHEQRHAGQLQVLGSAGMVDVVVGREPVADFLEWHAHALEIGEQGPDQARPTQVDQQPRSASADHPVVR